MHSRRTPARNVVPLPGLVLAARPRRAARARAAAARSSPSTGRGARLVPRRATTSTARPVKQAVIDFAGDPSIERVLMLTQLRVLGYVFNPVSFYWCYRGDGSLACMVSELSNTFGERLPEVLRGPELRYEHDKRLHVSPFFGLDQSLRVRVLAAGRRGLGADPRPRQGRRAAADRRPARPAARADEREPRRGRCSAIRSSRCR